MASITQLQQARTIRAAGRRRVCLYEQALQDALKATTYQEASQRGELLAQAMIEYLYANPQFAGSNVLGQIIDRISGNPVVATGVLAGLFGILERRLCGVSARATSFNHADVTVAV